MKKKIKMFVTEVTVAKLIAGPVEMEIEIFFEEIEHIDDDHSILRMAGIHDSIVDKTNPLKPRIFNKNYVSRIITKSVFELKGDDLYQDGELIEGGTLEFHARIVKRDDIN